MIVTRKRREKRRYFTQETEDAIVRYNNASDPKEKNKIYEEEIHYAFFKLTQNIIHTFKFYNTDVEDLEHLQHEIIVFLLNKIHLYHHSKSIDDRLNKIINKKYSNTSYKNYVDYQQNNPDIKPNEILSEIEFNKNLNISSRYPLYQLNSFLDYTKNSDKITLQQIKDFIEPYLNDVCEECKKELKRLTPPKAYSYFGTIVKRWLINYNKKNYSNKINSSPIEDLHHSLDFSYDLDSNNTSQDKLSYFLDGFVDYVDDNLYKYFPKSTDAQVADSVLELFRKREHIDVFNKKALYIYIREQGDFKTQKITKVSNQLFGIFKEKYIFYLENGYMNF